MGKSKKPTEFMKSYNINDDEVWEVRAGGAWAVKHAALERVAAELNITFDPPQLAEKDALGGTVAMLVVAKMGDRSEWSFGEASKANCKNSYLYSMAEKRGKDRCILKLINAHGALYSEEEADDFVKRENPHVTRPEDIVPDVEYDQHGQPVDNIPMGDERIERLPKAKARDTYAQLQAALYKFTDADELTRWGKDMANSVETLPTDWQAILRGQYKDHLHSLRQRTAA